MLTSKYNPTARQLALLFILASGISIHAQAPAAPDPVDASAIGTSFTPALMRDLPSSNDLFQLFETAEGEIISDRFYGGGLNTGRPALDGAFLNSWPQTAFFVGDVDITMPNGGVPFLFPTVTPWERVDVASAMMPLGANAPGLAVSLEPARPAATWTRVIEVSGSGGGLIARSSTTVAPPIETLRSASHGGLFVSGPLSPRVGVMADVEWAGASQVERTGLTQADGQAASVFANLVFTPDASHELRTVGWIERTQAPFAGATVFNEPIAADRTTFTHLQSTWERKRPRGQSWRVFGAYSQGDGSRADASPSAPVVERLTDGPVPLLVDSGDRTDRRWSAGTRATMKSGVHTFFLGGDVGRSDSRIGTPYTGPIGETIDGTRAQLWTSTTNGLGDAHRHISTFAAFISDRIALGPGRTFEAAVSYDGVEGSAQGAATGVTWNSLLPRLSLRWQQGPTSHFTWVAGYRRSADRLTTDTLAVGDPAAPYFNVTTWPSSGAPVVLYSTGPGTGTGSSANFTTIDPSLARPVTDEISAGIEARLTPNIRGRITGVVKETRHLFDLVNVGTPPSSYSTLGVVDGRPEADGGDVVLTVYNRPPSTADRYVLTNIAGQDTARAAALVLNSEADLRRLTLMFNATASITDGPAANRGFHADENNLGIGETASDLNGVSFARGRLFYDRAFTLKLSGVYRLPYGITVAAIARYQDGQPFSRITIVPGATTNLTTNQGVDFVRAYAAGDARFSYTGTLDMRVQKRMTVGATALDLFVDAYNLANMANEVEERVVTGPGFRDITAVQPPLSVHVGLRLGF